MADNNISSDGVDTGHKNKVLGMVKELVVLENQLKALIRLKESYQATLFEPSLLFRYRKDFRALWIALQLYTKYKSIALGTEAAQYIEQIRSYDRELAKEIERVIPFLVPTANIFSDLVAAMQKGDSYFVSYI